MKKEELKNRIIEASMALTKATNESDKELFKSYLDYYVDLALRLYKDKSEKEIV
jgi:hypothetical protein